MTKAMTRRCNAEKARLTALFKDLPPDEWALAEGLIDRAAWQRPQLEMLEEYLQENGWAVPFRQSKDLPAYDKSSPQAAEYQKLMGNYLKTIKDLKAWLPKTAAAEIDDGFDAFIARRD